MATFEGMNLDNIDETTQEEIESDLSRIYRARGPLYEVSSNVIMYDNRPDFGKLQRRVGRLFGSGGFPAGGHVVGSLGHLYIYICTGWEIGIFNEFRFAQREGVTKAQLLDVVMAAQLMTGMRGLEQVYRAVWMILRDFQDRPEPAHFPTGWAPDNAAFAAGIDFSTGKLLDSDLQGIKDWYTRTLGEVPAAISWSAEYNPSFLKLYRSKFERAFGSGTLPKQVMPYMMLRHATVFGFEEEMREAALLGKAWGMSRQWITHAVTASASYMNGMSGVAVAQKVLQPIFDNWDGAPDTDS